ncbi:M14 family zinc carboxypeptidase [Bacillus sp. FJAT-29814]|uniref:M14 family zinc carboxypeptidase n=1 Tax=Bacillus sp. FJAT-29814 TaxID=1729688 RepID=UPI0008330142|nr:M14 family zinc carboxypeptidase [Bacillus sp. FJAT-29814]
MKKLSILLTVCMCLVLFTTIASAEPQTTPNGPWVQPNQKVKLEAFTTIEELGKELKNIESRSKGRMKLEVAGYSNKDRPIYVAKFGEPSDSKKGIMIQSAIHGDEEAHIISTIDLIKTLATSGNKEVSEMLDKLTIWIVPMLNPDGVMFEVDGERWPQRLNAQNWTPEAWSLPANTLAPHYYGQRFGINGFDLNRDYHPNLNFKLNPETKHKPTPTYRGASSQAGFMVAPETHASVSLFKALKPKLFIDLHHQYPTYAQSTEDNGMNSLQILAEVMSGKGYTDLDGKYYPLDPEVEKLSKQVNSLVYQKLTQKGNSPTTNITKYGAVNLPGTALGAFTLNGAAIMLYELRGGSIYDTGQKANGMFVKMVYDGLYETLKAFVTGEVYQVDPTFYDTDIMPAGPRIKNPHPSN